MSKATQYKNNYIAANYDRINLTVPKGMKAQIEAFAQSSGKSVNGLINDLIRAALDGDLKAAPLSAKASPEPVKEKPSAPAKKDMEIFLF